MRFIDFLLIAGTITFFLVVNAKEAPPSQNWTLTGAGRDGQVHLRIEEHRPHHHTSHGRDIPWQQLSGIESSAMSKPGPVRFRYVTAPGTFHCTGEVRLFRASGSYTFQPDPNFTAELARLGFGGSADENELRQMALAGVQLELIRAISQTGLRGSLSDVHSLAIHGVTPELIRAVREAGYDHFSAHDFVQLKIHGAGVDLLRALRAAGYTGLTQHEIVQMRIHGVSPEYLRQVEQAGVRPQPAELVEYKIHGVPADLLRALAATGAKDVSSREVIQLRQHGVPAAFIEQAHAMGYRFSPRELADLRVHGVDVGYLEKLKRSGYANLDAKQITKLRTHGID